MAQYSKEQVIETMKGTGMIPVFYNPDIETSKKVLKACYDGGVRVFEFTNRGDKAKEVFNMQPPCRALFWESVRYRSEKTHANS